MLLKNIPKLQSVIERATQSVLVQYFVTSKNNIECCEIQKFLIVLKITVSIGTLCILELAVMYFRT